jgi:hypothetical protein
MGGELAEYFGLMLLTELASPKAGTETDRIRDCWAVLTECEQRYIVHPGEITERLHQSALLALTRYLKLIQPTVFEQLLRAMSRELELYTYIHDFGAQDPTRLKAKDIADMKVKRVLLSELKAMYEQTTEVPGKDK